MTQALDNLALAHHPAPLHWSSRRHVRKPPPRQLSHLHDGARLSAFVRLASDPSLIHISAGRPSTAPRDDDDMRRHSKTQNGKTSHAPPRNKMAPTTQHLLQQDGIYDAGAAQAIVDAQQATCATGHTRIAVKRQRSSRSTTAAAADEKTKSAAAADLDAYNQARGELCEAEASLSFDYRCRVRATPLEQKVDMILHELRRTDQERVYDAAAPRQGHEGQRHRRFAGDHFLSNVELIDQTALFDVARHMPKGAHLHIHFNACLPPAVLLGIAKDMDRMFITSNLPLVPDNNYENYAKCEIQFSLLSVDKEDDAPGNLFSSDYQPRQTMKFDQFLTQFSRFYPDADPEEWLLAKLVFDEEEAHGLLQTAAG